MFTPALFHQFLQFFQSVNIEFPKRICRALASRFLALTFDLDDDSHWTCIDWHTYTLNDEAEREKEREFDRTKEWEPTKCEAINDHWSAKGPCMSIRWERRRSSSSDQFFVEEIDGRHTSLQRCSRDFSEHLSKSFVSNIETIDDQSMGFVWSSITSRSDRCGNGSEVRGHWSDWIWRRYRTTAEINFSIISFEAKRREKRSSLRKCRREERRTETRFFFSLHPSTKTGNRVISRLAPKRIRVQFEDLNRKYLFFARFRLSWTFLERNKSSLLLWLTFSRLRSMLDNVETVEISAVDSKDSKRWPRWGEMNDCSPMDNHRTLSVHSLRREKLEEKIKLHSGDWGIVTSVPGQFNSRIIETNVQCSFDLLDIVLDQIRHRWTLSQKNCSYEMVVVVDSSRTYRSHWWQMSPLDDSPSSFSFAR